MPLRRFSLLAASVLALVCAQPAAAQPLPLPRQPDVSLELQRYTADVLREYTAMVGDWREAWGRGDAVATARFYTEDATLLPPSGAQTQGRGAIEHYLREHLAECGEIRLGVADFATSGSLAYASGRYWLQEHSADQTTEVSGAYMAVLRLEGRRWRIRAQMFVADEGTP
jgi:uncharacterized protein (TIGR02246 family)